MWFWLFCALGGNFLDYGFLSDPWLWGYIVCGVVFELMAFPALYFLLPFAGTSVRTPTGKQRKKRARRARATRAGGGPTRLARLGATIGYPVWDALK